MFLALVFLATGMPSIMVMGGFDDVSQDGETYSGVIPFRVIFRMKGIIRATLFIAPSRVVWHQQVRLAMVESRSSPTGVAATSLSRQGFGASPVR